MPELSAQVIEWAIHLLTAVIGGVVAALIVYRWRRDDEKRDSHLAELRTEVFGPMLEYLDKDVLPILRREAGNVGVCLRETPSTGEMTTRLHVEQFICVRPVFVSAQVCALGVNTVRELPSPPGGHLVDDARRHHFPGLFRTWDAVVARFQKYNDACLQYVKDLRAQIADENPLLPEFTLESSALGSTWLNAVALAVIVYLQQMGRPLGELTFKRDGVDQYVLSYDMVTLAQADLWAIGTLKASVDKVLSERGQVEELLASAEPLAAEVAALRATIDQQRLKRRLPGKCEYL